MFFTKKPIYTEVHTGYNNHKIIFYGFFVILAKVRISKKRRRFRVKPGMTFGFSGDSFSLGG
ncbi:MAG TPA: hypothetical protein DEQ14_11855 [Treponema sp.]|nr:hypothetical protein [Treponema sp.]